MRMLVYGNSGSGKSTYAQALAAHRRIFEAHRGDKREHTSVPEAGGTA